MLVALGGCFDTPTPSIAFRCGGSGVCPASYECRDDGCCHLIGSSQAERCELTPAVDAARPPDAGIDGSPADASTIDASMTPDAMIDAMPDVMIDASPPDASMMPDAMPDAMPDVLIDASPPAP